MSKLGIGYLIWVKLTTHMCNTSASFSLRSWLQVQDKPETATTWILSWSYRWCISLSMTSTHISHMLNCTVRSEFCLSILTLIFKEQKLTEAGNISRQNTLHNDYKVCYLSCCAGGLLSQCLHITQLLSSESRYRIKTYSNLLSGKKVIIRIWWFKSNQNHAIIY